MSGWREVKLGEIFEISSSKRVLQEDWKSSGVPFYRAREIVRLAKDGDVDNELFISEELYETYRTKYGVPKAGDLMVSAVGTLGACYIVQPTDRFYYKDASVLRLSPKQEVCSKIIQHAFRTSKVLDQVHAGAGSTVGTYTIQRANETRINLPNLAEQRRLAAILDQAEALRAKRREALAQLNSLTQSIFIEMFGDPASNPKGWPSSKLGDLVHSASDGPHVSPIYAEHGVPFLSARHVRPGAISWHDLKYLTRNDAEFQWKKCKPSRGDILYTKGGTTGFAAVVRTDEEFSVWVHVALLKPNHRLVDSTWLESMLNTQYCYRQSQELTHGIANRDLGLKRMVNILMYNPPLALQREFAQRMIKIDQQKQLQLTGLAEFDNLFSSLQHYAFRGEL